MTGYAVLEFTLQGRKLQAHAKSVNHRFFEFRWRVPRDWSAFEIAARQILQSKLKRGALDIWIDDGESASEGNGVEGLFRSLADALTRSAAFSALPEEKRLEVLLRRPDAWQSRNSTTPEEKEIRAAFETLAERLLSSRRQEGAATGEVLRRHGARLAELRRSIAEKAVTLLSNWQTDTRKKLEGLAAELQIGAPSQERVAQEFLLLAEKRDVAEELNRIEIHLKAFDALFSEASANDGVGKRLEFLVQELHREWTTLGNKIHDAQAGQTIIDAKLEIEKIREQSLNLV